MLDLRYAVRSLLAKPLVSGVAVLSLALGIGANTAIFSIVDALVLRPLPVRDAARLTLLTAGESWFDAAWSNPVWEAVRDRVDLHGGAFAFSSTGFNLAERGIVDPVEGLRASGAMFEVLGVEAVAGRTFTVADDRRDGGPDGPVAVISHSFWERRYGGAADAVGRTIVLNRVPFTIIGVAPASFFGPEVGRSFDVAVPLGTVALLNGDASVLESATSLWLRVMLRLRPDQSIERATAALRAVQPQIVEATRPTSLRPDDAARYLERPFTLAPAATGGSELRGVYQKPVLALMAIVALVLLIACGNIANLLLARSTARRHELSVRTALGASRGRLVRQLLTESLLLAATGAALGLAIALFGSRVILSQLATAQGTVALDLGVSWRVLGFTCALAVGTALLFGTLPALRAARVAPIEAMKEQGRGGSSTRGDGLAGSLVVAQVALSLVLVVGASLFVRSFATLVGRDMGFEHERVLLVHMGAPGAGIPVDERLPMYESILAGVRSVPGVSGAALSMMTPVGGGNSTRIMEFPSRPALPEAERRVWLNVVTPGWFDALGTAIVAGRDFDERDRWDATRVVVVNRAFVDRYFAGENPIGREIVEGPTPSADPVPLEIVGVVEDAVYRSPREPIPATMYLPVAQQRRPPAGLSLVVRAASEPASVARPVAAAVSRVNPDLTLVVRPLSANVDAALTQERILATLSGFFGALALLLAGLGLYGVIAYSVSRRRIELAIRMALGASPGAAVRVVLARVVRLVGAGVAIGAAAAWWASTLVGSLLYGLAPRDPAAFLGALVVLGAVAAVAGWRPVARAAGIEPAQVMRDG